MALTNTTNLNLARKWRPKTFDTVVGQELAVRMLKNSLYLNKFFPVYLFAGQRGCGKTSTARIFAAAVNCAQLPSFQQNPAASIPCLSCASCSAMTQGDHPDFIEIDAASHTGVDNVRQIIESASYMPLIGQKKIYLIDEAHMLSKAAFNAFLKILEEPPMSVMFLLATTETPKFPATVLSRCFQLIFNPIQNQNLKQHLQQICTQENISIDNAALDLLLDETEGSARDAINLLERVRFSHDVITEDIILSVLGKISLKDLLRLFDLIIAQQAGNVLLHLQAIQFHQRSPQLFWDMFIQLCRNIAWVKYGVSSFATSISKHLDDLKKRADSSSLNRLIAMLNLLWTQEELFLKTNKKHLFIEMVLLQLAQQVNVVDLEDLIKSCASTNISMQSDAAPATPTTSEPQNTQSLANTASIIMPKPAHSTQTINQAPPSEINQDWNRFLAKIATLSDPLLQSILSQASFVSKNEETKQICIQLSTDSAFFKNKIDETTSLWKPFLIEVFTGFEGFYYVAPQKKIDSLEAELMRQSTTPIKAQPSASPPLSTKPSIKESEFLTIKDQAKWPIASLILRHFSGKIKKIKNDHK